MQELGTNTNTNKVSIISKEIETNEAPKNYYRIIKRFLDIAGSLLGVILLSPVFLILAILVKLDSKGPVFFGHSRLGQNGKIIKIYKYRTMVSNAEEILKNLPEEKKKEFEVNFKFDDDPRITRVGKILRETSLDELPQLINILKGDLSIVGPRPIVKDELKKYGEFGDKLLSIKPGLTGYWQANGRSDTTYDERVGMDMYYIDKRNLLMDFNIIFKTFSAVFRKSGAK